MERRDFLSGSIAEIIPKFESKNYDTLFQTHSFDVKSGLEEYAGEWTPTQITHLLRKTLFGFNKGQFDIVSDKSLDEIVSLLLADSELPPPPININDQDPAKVGDTWVGVIDDTKEPNVRNQRINSVRSWWSLLMLNQGISIREKMTLFLHNHFSTETEVYREPHFAYWQNQLEREYALGNFQELTEKITIDPAMLAFLNGNQNSNRAPNENYARELMELFTIGKGPLIEEGNYTNYTEDDIQEAAKVLTGWYFTLRDDNEFEVKFRVGGHTGGVKKFSSAFGNREIAANGAEEYKDLIQMIFDQEETAKFICRKLYRWFVHNKIDLTVEKNMIEPMANIFRTNNYQLKPVLEALLKSQHFYDKNIIGCMIKNPIDYIYGMYKQFDVKQFAEAEESLAKKVLAYNLARNLGAEFGFILQMYILDPPGVAGWTPYYQIPSFNRLWLNSVTLPYRFQFAVGFAIEKLQMKIGDNKIALLPELLQHVEIYSDPSDADKLVKEVSEYLFPVELTQKQLDYLKLAIVPLGEEDYVWAGIWTGYKNDPSNENLKNAAKSRLTNLYIIALSLAEYQLS